MDSTMLGLLCYLCALACAFVTFADCHHMNLLLYQVKLLAFLDRPDSVPDSSGVKISI